MIRVVAVLGVFSVFIECSQNSTPLTVKRPIEEDYYLNYDYDISNSSANVQAIMADPLILPNPETVDSRYTVDVLPNVELPDDSLSDSDLRDHDFIDNLMYVYYGSHGATNSRGGAHGEGPELIIVGSVLSCAAQLLTIFCVLLLKQKNLTGGSQKQKWDSMRALFLQLMATLCLSNLLFMLGVYASRNSVKCLVIALSLHYLHLLTAFWIFLYCFYIYSRISGIKLLETKYLLSIAYGLPLIFSLVSWQISPHSFETKRFCFMSVQKGMIVNYMIPVSSLIIITTFYSLNGVRKINNELAKLEFNTSAESLMRISDLEMMLSVEKRLGVSPDEETAGLREAKSCLKLLCGVQTAYDIVWFIVVLALENAADNNSGMSVVYSITACLLNWYIFAKTKWFLPSIKSSTGLHDDPGGDQVHNNHDAVVCGSHKSLNKDKCEVECSDNDNDEDLMSDGKNDKQDSCDDDHIPLLFDAISNGGIHEGRHFTNNVVEMRELKPDYISTISS